MRDHAWLKVPMSPISGRASSAPGSGYRVGGARRSPEGLSRRTHVAPHPSSSTQPAVHSLASPGTTERYRPHGRENSFWTRRTDLAVRANCDVYVLAHGRAFLAIGVRHLNRYL